jgi:hypothetical protein
MARNSLNKQFGDKKLITTRINRVKTYNLKKKQQDYVRIEELIEKTMDPTD